MTKTDSEHFLQVKSTAVVTRFLYKMFENAGVDANKVFKVCGIDPALLEDSNYRVLHEKLLHMWEVAAQLSGDANFGLNLALQVPSAPFNVVGYLAMTSKNLRELCEGLQKYMRIFTDKGTVTTIEKGDVTKICIDLTGGLQSNRHHTDFWQTYLYKLLNFNIGWTIPIKVAAFGHKKPADITMYEKIYQSELKFDQPQNFLSFSSVYLDYETISSDAAMHKFHETQAIQHLHALTEDGIVNKVKRVIMEYLPANDIELQCVAKKLNLTARTVQRNLANDGTTFKTILDQARKDYTLREIGNMKFSISELAFRLGYQDLSSFYRAFKRWTGMTPIDYREKMSKE